MFLKTGLTFDNTKEMSYPEKMAKTQEGQEVSWLFKSVKPR